MLSASVGMIAVAKGPAEAEGASKAEPASVASALTSSVRMGVVKLNREGLGRAEVQPGWINKLADLKSSRFTHPYMPNDLLGAYDRREPQTRGRAARHQAPTGYALESCQIPGSSGLYGPQIPSRYHAAL